MISEVIYKGHDNVISVECRSNGIAQDISGATKITLEIGGATISSATAGSGVFDFTTYGADGRLDMKLGTLADIKKLKPVTYRARLTVFDLTYPNGRVWDDMMIEVKA